MSAPDTSSSPSSNPQAGDLHAPDSNASDFPLTEAQRASGDWNPLWDTLREWDPDFVEAYIHFRLAPRRKGPLSPVVRELLLIAVNACTTHLYAPGVRRHIDNALNLGATREEILEAIQITTLVGIHSCNLAVPILKEALEQRQDRGGQPA